MAKLNLDYYSGDNRYSDGDIENEILKIAEDGILLGELGKVEFPILYHLSDVRHNILNWYPFKEDAVCLEIGSGCGAISGLLCKKVKKVVSIELSKRRADINFARHREAANLEIMVGNLNDMTFPYKFDYIVLNGVFEYAMSFTESDKPYEDFLAFVLSLLKEDGILLVAIENRLGLKYFAGAPEDHTNAYMDGLKGYPGNDSVRTFSKSEWIDLMDTCGIADHKFYYPYPDYKFPGEIFTDETLESQKYGRRIWNFTENRFALFSEEEMAAAFRREGVMDRFANSFLIEMSKSPIRRKREVLYAKINSNRKANFAISTVIERTNDSYQVVKHPLTEEAKAHITKMAHAQSTGGKYQLLKGTWQQDSISYPLLSRRSLGYEAEAAIRDKDAARVQQIVHDLYEQCLLPISKESGYCSKEFAEVFGSRILKDEKDICICPANIDLILDNIFMDGDHMQVIDGEWIFDFPIPIRFIIWRTINEIYSNCPWFDEQVKRSVFMQKYGIDEQKEQTFWAWSTHFAHEYVGAGKLDVYDIAEVGVSLETYRQERMQKVLLDSTLYLDTGNGFSEDETVKVQTRLTEDSSFKVKFTLPNPSKIKCLRFDPLEGRPCCCRLVCEGAVLAAENAVGKEDGNELFLTADPAYKVIWRGNLPEQLEISGVVEVLDKDWALNKYTQMYTSSRQRLKFWR